MDELLKYATHLADQTSHALSLPIKGRVAYVVSHGQSYASNGYAIRTQGVAKALNQHGLETLCFVRPGRPWELKQNTQSVRPEVTIQGVRYIHSRWPDDVAPTHEREHLEASVQHFMTLFSVYRPEVVLAASNWIVGLPAWVAAKRLGLPFYNEVRGFWELSKAAHDPAYEGSKTSQIDAERDTFVAKQGRATFTLNAPMQDELIKRGVKRENIKLVPNGVSQLPNVVPADSALKKQLGINEDEQVVGYIGSHSVYEGLDTLVEACAALVKQGVKIKLLLVGDHQPVTGAKTTPDSESTPPWVIKTGRVPHEQVSRYYALIDLVVIPRKPLRVCELVPPMKAVEALTHGKQLLMSDLPALRAVVPAHTNVTYTELKTPDDVSQAIKACLARPAKTDLSGIEHLTLSHSVKPMVALLKGTVAAKPASGQTGKAKPQPKAAAGDFASISQRFYKKGEISSVVRAIRELCNAGAKLDKPQRDFLAFVEGMARLKGGWPVPPRQPNPGLMSQRRHALYCLHQSVPHATNGYATRSHGIAVGLQQAGWTVRVTTRPGFPWDAGAKGLHKGYHETQVDGVTYAAVAGWNLSKTPLDYYLAEAADHYVREAQTSGAEVIIAASNHITALPALMAARRLGLPFVYEVRGLWEVTQASTQPEWADSERYHLMRELEQQAAREADLVITLTDELRRELAEWGVEEESIVVIPNAVNADTFVPTPRDPQIAETLGLKAGVPVIGYAGSAVAYEGLELLLEGMALLKHQKQDFVFVLVGDGKVIDTVKEKAKTLGIENQCRFTGRIPFDEVPRYLSCMDIMPVPRLSSAVTEMVSALKPLEAMAMGKAVVLSNVSPHLTMAGDNERAWLFEKDSADSLAEALNTLIQKPLLREQLGQAARQWIEQERTWNYVTQNYHQALLRLEKPGRHETAPAAKSLDQITLGLIADQFTTDTLASGVKVVALSPENWQRELEEQPIDVMFVESAWKGNDWAWHRKVGYYSDEEFEPLSALLAHCRDNGIPSLFWNKEDPVHFDRFRKTAALCDHVFTTDSRRIIPYLATPDAQTQTVSSCAFYASPKIHNLLPSKRPWQHTAAYGGTYYGKRYPERTEYMDKIMSAAAPLGLTIYDRQHDDPDSPYKYPGGLGSYVAGSLSYEEMIEAYKAHPVQINVNSVLDSPTMFSRRVTEAAACGAPIISGPALGMNRYLEEAGHVVRLESEAAQALENLMHHDAYRWHVALKGARAVMRAHTTQTRLTQMLRTAGMRVLAPSLPCISLFSETLTEAAAQGIVHQTVWPARVAATTWSEEAKALLAAVGIECLEAKNTEVQANEYWLSTQASALESAEPEDIEDLAWTTAYSPYTRSVLDRADSLTAGEWAGVAYVSDRVESSFQLMLAQDSQSIEQLVSLHRHTEALALRKPSKHFAQAPNVAPSKTVVIAGHDLKFIKPFYPYFTKAGMRLLLDFWNGHNQHNETASKRLVRQADTIFCEWTLGNAIWYGKHKREGQKLVGRLHLQEIDHALFPKIPFEAFDTVMFVGPHILRQGIAKNPVLKKNGVVVYNGVDVEGLQSVQRKPTNGKVLGFVGIVPQRKRFDLALDILRELRKEDDGYILRIKGKRPEEYPWMVNRPEEMAWYENQYRRLEEDPLLKGAVIFDPHGNDMPEWYAGIDFALSTSDFESFHFTIADGAASGCTPIILPWEGADEIYPKEWVYADAKAAAEGIKAGPGDQISLKVFAKEKFDMVDISNAFIGTL